MSKSSDFRSSVTMAWPIGPDAWGLLFERGCGEGEWGWEWEWEWGTNAGYRDFLGGYVEWHDEKFAIRVDVNGYNNVSAQEVMMRKILDRK